MQTLIVLIEFTPLVNFLTNSNSCCCCISITKTKSAHCEHRIYGSRPAGCGTVNVESTDPGRNVLMTLSVAEDHKVSGKRNLSGLFFVHFSTDQRKTLQN